MALYREQRDELNTLVGYVRTADGVVIPISQENRDYRKVAKWIAAGNAPDPDSDILNKVKRLKRAAYRTEGVKRISLQVSEWNTYDRVAFVASIWNMLGNPSAAQTGAKDIYVYVKNTAIPNVNAQVDVASVQAIDVANDPNWP